MSDVIVQYLRDDIEIVRGGDWHETINFYEDDGTTPLDTTGYTMTMNILKSHPNGEPFDELTVASGNIIHTPASGQFNLSLTAAEIDEYNFTSAVFRMKLDYGDGTVQVFRIGNVKVV